MGGYLPCEEFFCFSCIPEGSYGEQHRCWRGKHGEVRDDVGEVGLYRAPADGPGVGRVGKDDEDQCADEEHRDFLLGDVADREERQQPDDKP